MISSNILTYKPIQYKSQSFHKQTKVDDWLSQITYVSVIKRLEDLYVVSFEASTIREPFLILCYKVSISLLSQFNHFIKFLREAFLVRPNLSQYFITIEAKYKLRLILHSIMSCNFRRDIAINFDNLQKSVFCCQFLQLLVCNFALRIPTSAEIDEGMSESVFIEISVELFKACEVFEVGVEEPICDFEH